MTPAPAATASPKAHVVQFYEDDTDLIAGVGAYLIRASLDGATAVVIATEAHRSAFTEHLAAHGIDPAAAQREGTLVLLDAAGALARFMPAGRPDRKAFLEVMGGVLRDAAAGGRPVRAYGEMVALLWDAGDVLAAIDLETYWNELGTELPFDLYCAYRTDSVAGHERADALHEVCRLHAAVVPAPGDAVVLIEDYRAERRAIADARHLVAGAIRRWGHDAALVADAEIVVTELAANALIHAATPFRVRLERCGPMVRISVDDGGPSLPRLIEPDASRLSGRGVHLIDAIARRWGVEVTRDGKTVWAELGR